MSWRPTAQGCKLFLHQRCADDILNALQAAHDPMGMLVSLVTAKHVADDVNIKLQCPTTACPGRLFCVTLIGFDVNGKRYTRMWYYARWFFDGKQDRRERIAAAKQARLATAAAHDCAAGTNAVNAQRGRPLGVQPAPKRQGAREPASGAAAAQAASTSALSPNEVEARLAAIPPGALEEAARKRQACLDAAKAQRAQSSSHSPQRGGQASGSKSTGKRGKDAAGQKPQHKRRPDIKAAMFHSPGEARLACPLVCRSIALPPFLRMRRLRIPRCALGTPAVFPPEFVGRSLSAQPPPSLALPRPATLPRHSSTPQFRAGEANRYRRCLSRAARARVRLTREANGRGRHPAFRRGCVATAQSAWLAGRATAVRHSACARVCRSDGRERGRVRPRQGRG